jgi:hypothetical protein
MKTLLTLSLCLLVSHYSFAQSKDDTEKWISETLQANAQPYKVRQAHGQDKSALSFLTFSDFSFQFEDGYFIIHCQASYPRYRGADAVDQVMMRLPLWDLKIASNAAEKAGEGTYDISFGTTSAAFQYVNETSRYHEKKWAFTIRVPARGNEDLAGKLKEAFNQVNKEYGNPLTIK